MRSEGNGGGGCDPLPASHIGSFRTVAAAPFYASLLIALVLVGFRESMTGPYLTLFAVERAHLGPLALGAFVTVRAAGAIVISMAFGAWYDRTPSILPLVLSLAAGIVGYALLSTTTNFGLLLVIAGLPLGMSTATFPLIFALAKGHLSQTDAMTAERGSAMLRASFSAAWGIGPALGAVLVGAYDYDGLFWASSACGLIGCVSLAWSGIRAPDRPVPGAAETAAPRASRRVGLAAASLTFFSAAISMGAVALPLVMTNDLAGSKGDVGLASSLCALLEVPVMMAIAMRPARFLGYGGMVAGFVALALYFVAVALAPSVAAVIAAQALRAVGIGFVGCVGISYLQDMMPNRIGAAAALYSNTSQVGALIAGLAVGSWAHLFGYHAMFWACAAVTLAGWGVLALGRRV